MKTSLKRKIATCVAVLIGGLVGYSQMGITATLSADQRATIARRLIVLFDPRTLPNAHHDVVMASVAPTSSPAGAALLRDLQNPAGARKAFSAQELPNFSSPSQILRPESLLPRYVLLTYADASTALAAKQVLKGNPAILSVEQDSTISFAGPDPWFAAQPANNGYQGQWGLTALNFPGAWGYTSGNAYVAVIDTGVEADINLDATHVTREDLDNLRFQFSRSFDVWASDRRPSTIVSDLLGHGTHVAGIIGASTNNSVGVSGSCGNCALMIVRIQTSYTEMVDAINYAVRAGAQVINMSFTRYDYPFCDTSVQDYNAACQALLFARQRGVTIVAASGNSYNTHPDAARGNSSIGFPAAYGPAIAVGGLERTAQGQLQFWQGKNAVTQVDPATSRPLTASIPFGSDSGPEQALVAPATEVFSTFLSNKAYGPFTPPDVAWSCVEESFTLYWSSQNYTDTFYVGPHPSPKYGMCTGTSMAAPHVSGVAAIVRSANPLLSSTDTKLALMSTASQATSWSATMGYGYPNAQSAVEQALGKINLAQQTNRITPLFAFYSETAKNHFYTTVPQMGTAALRGTLKPLPRNQTSMESFLASCHRVAAGICQDKNDQYAIRPPSPITITSPISGAVEPIAEVFFWASLSDFPYTDGAPRATESGFAGTITLVPYLYMAPSATAQTVTIHVRADSDTTVALPYLPVGPEVPGYPCFPSICVDVPPQPKPAASLYVHTTFRNPTGGTDLLPLYRLSYRCGDLGGTNAITECPFNAAHVSHVYSTDQSELAAIKAMGYRLDGIEGYIFPPGSVPALPNITKVYRRYNNALHDYVIVPESELSSYETSLQYNQRLFSVDYIGYAYTSFPASQNTPVLQFAIRRPSQSLFIIDYNGDQTADYQFGFGTSTDVGLVGDMNFDGKSDFIVFRNGIWYVDYNDGSGHGNSVTDATYALGAPGDAPLLADVNGDGKVDLIVYRAGIWYVWTNWWNSPAPPIVQTYAFGGVAGDIPLSADIDGDGLADLIIYRVVNGGGVWFVDTKRIGIPAIVIDFGLGSPPNQAPDIPIAADWNGDGRADLIILRPSSTSGSPEWYVDTRRDGIPSKNFLFGINGDLPLVGKFN